MAYEQRKPLLEAVESLTGNPLVVYVTSHRPNAGGQIGGDATRFFIDQLFALPEGTKNLDIIIHSLGGDGLTIEILLMSYWEENVQESNYTT
jgi:hypothetical protein